MSILMVFIFLSSISVMLQLVIPVCFSLRKTTGDKIRMNDSQRGGWTWFCFGDPVWASESANITAIYHL